MPNPMPCNEEAERTQGVAEKDLFARNGDRKPQGFQVRPDELHADF